MHGYPVTNTALFFPANLKHNSAHPIRKAVGISTLALLFAYLCCGISSAQMVSPGIDHPDEPFSYFSKPTDVIGVMDARTATEVTPEGYLYSGYGELMFFTGGMDVPFSHRIKTLEDGYLPILHYCGIRQHIQYCFTVFEASLDGKPDGTLVNFIRVTIKNTTSEPRTAYFSTGFRYINPINTADSGGDNRYIRPRPLQPRAVYQMGVTYNPDWVYGFRQNAFLRNDRAVYLYPAAPAPRLRLTLKNGYNRIPETTASKLNILPDTPVGIVQYKLPLLPSAETSLIFKEPVIPVPPSSSDYQAIEQADFNTYLQQTKDFWNKILSQGTQIRIPEAKVEQTYRASLIYDLIARDKVGSQYIQTVNKFQYHRFYLRDSADISHMYDLTGYPVIARQVLDYFLTTQQPDGNFISQPGQFDGWSEALYAFGAHYQITHDKAFAAQVYPAVQKAILWLQKAREQDPLHLVPATTILDNEYVTGHLTGNNFLALDGLKNAVLLAHAVGNEQDAQKYEAMYQDFRRTLLQVLASVTAKTNGYIPPTLDGTTHGEDWGNMLSVTPEQILSPFDPRVTATLRETQAKYQEGIMTYGGGRFLHHYLTIKNTLTEIIRDDAADQQQAIHELYALLVHTSSTHAGFEYAIRPWGNRDFGINLAPHGWFASDYRTLIRTMLVREEGEELHLLSDISPEWVEPGQAIAIQNAPTTFGDVSFTLQFPTSSEAILKLNSEFSYGHPKLVMHLPWFMQVSSITADGKPLTWQDNRVVLPSNARQVLLHWQRAASAPALSYLQAVTAYKQEYALHYQKYLQDGFQP